jgi:glutathione synthase
MVHVDPETNNARPEIKQVEFNTIASSFGGLSQKVTDLHG